MNLIFVILTITFYFTNKTVQNILIKTDDYLLDNNLLNCVNRIVGRDFISDKGITVLSRGSKDHIKGISKSGKTVVSFVTDLTKLSDKNNTFNKVKDAVIFLEGNFPRDIETLDYLDNFHPRSRLLLAFIIPVDEGSLSVENYLINLVDNLILNKNEKLKVIFAIGSIDGIVQLYGYTKTAYGNCGKPKLLNFGDCNDVKKNFSHIFSRYINYNQCPLRLATFNWSPMTRFIIKNGVKKSVGIESNIVNIIVELINASTNFLEIPPSEIRENIGKGNADIGWGQLALYETNQYSYTKSYVFAHGVIMLPKSSSAFQLTLNNLLPFKKMVWISLLILIVSIFILRNILTTFKIISLLNTLGLCLGLGTATRPKKIPHRVYYISLALFGYVITQAYLANLTLIFTKSEDQSQINSLKELDESDIPFGGPKLNRKSFQNKYPRIYKEYKEMNLTEFQENLIRLKTGDDGGFATYVEVSKYVNYDDWETIITLPEKIVSYPLGMAVPNVSDILAVCNFVITRILESGIMSHWAEMEIRKSWEDYNPKDESADIEVQDRIGFQKFFTIFQLLIFALGISLIVFIMEIIIFKILL